NFQAYRESIGNSKNSISAYMRAVRAIYNGAIAEDRFKTNKNPFLHFKVPSTSRTKKRAIIKESFFRIKKLEYQEGSPLWHAKNYALIMFNCRGMNFADLVKLKVKHIDDDRVNYGRSKTGEAISIGMTPELQKIISYYSEGKEPQDYLFPANNDGSTKSFEKYKSQRRRMNGYL
ncbi:site-specific integrase, partial [Flavobacteriaceae bacterium F89]|nr:site-specific integrase [Cerina litoralis]